MPHQVFRATVLLVAGVMILVSRNAPRWIRMLRRHGYLESSRLQGTAGAVAPA